MIDNFYHSFENKYRGSRELIKARLQVYLPFVTLLLEKNRISENNTLDLGFVRGEWFEILKELCFNTKTEVIDKKIHNYLK